MTSLENSMPMTTTLMNRMSKRKDMVVGTKYIIKQQRLSEPTDQYGRSAVPLPESAVIHHPVYHAAPPSFTAMPILTLPTQAQGQPSSTTARRVGSFRSRLKKQGHITSDCNNSSSNNVGGATAAVVGAAATVAPAIEVSVPVQVEREISQERERNNSTGSRDGGSVVLNCQLPDLPGVFTTAKTPSIFQNYDEEEPINVNADETMMKNATSTFRSNNSQSLSQSSRSQSKGSRASKDDPGSDPATRYLSPPLSSATAAVYKVQE